ncbi:MAG: regulatory protein RecX [Ignavibacteriales bacterium]|nr:regulatory protein RecX [Ignavibacteriales bacterium]
MRISSIQKLRNNVEIYFEDGLKIKLDYRVVFDNGLRRNDDLDEEKVNSLLSQSEKLKIKDSAFRFLARRHHSSQEIFKKLLNKGYKKEDISAVLEKMKRDGFVDDLLFAKAFAEEKLTKKKLGLIKVKAELMKKGVDRRIIDAALSHADSSMMESNAVLLIEKKMKFLKGKESDEKKIKQKLFSFLYSKGFDSEIITSALNKLNIGGDENFDL